MEPKQQASQGATHRATYTLEFGTWKATCRTCGWVVRDPKRRQAAADFRMHIRDARAADEAAEAGGGSGPPIDLTDPAADLPAAVAAV